MRYYYRIAGKIRFPEGLAVGEDRDSNVIALAKNGKGQPILRGTSLAGAIRSALIENNVDEKIVKQWFGESLNGSVDSGVASQIQICDVILSATYSEYRTHNMINRHTGSVADSALYSIQALPPDTEGFLLIYLQTRNADSADFILNALKHVFGEELLLGGNRNRGIGRMDATAVKCLKVDVDTADGFAKWQDLRYNDRLENFSSDGEPFAEEDIRYRLNLNLKLRIPQGEDIVVGYGTTIDGKQSAPQSVFKADGKEYWRIPGSTFRGIFRGWMTRLAKKDGCELRYQKQEDGKADLFGWGGISESERSNYKKNPNLLNDPILDLFGSLYKRGRIHFSDAYSTVPADKSTENHTSKDVQQRMHIAIDAFSGGTNPGMLFSNDVLVNGVFSLSISLAPSATQKDDAWKRDVKWLKKTLYALHLGIISVGSSKGSGLLEIENWNEIEKILDKEIEGGV